MQNPFRFPAAASFAALFLLAACSGGETTEASAEQNAADAANAAAGPVELPPMVTASRTYRCKDNSLVYIDFLNNQTAQYRTEKGGTPTILTAPEDGKPYVAEGFSVSSSGPDISLTAPGKGTTSCKA